MPSNCLLTNSGQLRRQAQPCRLLHEHPHGLRRRWTCRLTSRRISARVHFVTPNLCNDTHDCTIATGDAWLSTFLGKVFASSQYAAGETAVFITWDEDDSSSQQPHRHDRRRAVRRPGRGRAARFNHYSMLRTTEEMLGLGLLGNAASATSMRQRVQLLTRSQVVALHDARTATSDEDSSLLL